MKPSKADLVARGIIGLVIIVGLMLVSVYSFGLAMMSLPLLLSGIFIVFVIAFPFYLIVKAIKGRKEAVEPNQPNPTKPVHENDGERTILYRADQDSAPPKQG